MSHQSDLISQDIHAYLAQHERKELLRFLTCLLYTSPSPRD